MYHRHMLVRVVPCPPAVVAGKPLGVVEPQSKGDDVEEEEREDG